jgi:hypothetical protein
MAGGLYVANDQQNVGRKLRLLRSTSRAHVLQAPIELERARSILARVVPF